MADVSQPAPSARFLPQQVRGGDRSASPSPTRRSRFLTHELDPLLSTLSPARILSALSDRAANSPADDRPGPALQASIARASLVERAFGCRAASAAKSAQEWHREITSWEWPSGGPGNSSKAFEAPTVEERAWKRRKLADTGRDDAGERHVGIAQDGGVSGQVTRTEHVTGMVQVEEEYWGGLPRSVVVHYEARLDAISRGVDELDVEELKEHALDAHVPSRSRPASSDGPDESLLPLAYPHLDDFTAVTTATILRALPYLDRLARLLDIWSTRLSVLRKIPSFLLAFEDARMALRSGWNAVGAANLAQEGLPVAGRSSVSVAPVPSHEKAPPIDLVESDRRALEPTAPSASSDLTSEGFKTIRAILEEKISLVGKQLDSMLDALEGREETVPDRWIDDMEAVEANYADWVMMAERRVLGCEWRRAVEADRAASFPIQAATLDPAGSEALINPDNSPGESSDVRDRSAIPAVDGPVEETLSVAREPFPNGAGNKSSDRWDSPVIKGVASGAADGVRESEAVPAIDGPVEETLSVAEGPLTNGANGADNMSSDHCDSPVILDRSSSPIGQVGDGKVISAVDGLDRESALLPQEPSPNGAGKRSSARCDSPTILRMSSGASDGVWERRAVPVVDSPVGETLSVAQEPFPNGAGNRSSDRCDSPVIPSSPFDDVWDENAVLDTTGLIGDISPLPQGPSTNGTGNKLSDRCDSPVIPESASRLSDHTGGSDAPADVDEPLEEATVQVPRTPPISKPSVSPRSPKRPSLVSRFSPRPGDREAGIYSDLLEERQGGPPYSGRLAVAATSLGDLTYYPNEDQLKDIDGPLQSPMQNDRSGRSGQERSVARPGEDDQINRLSRSEYIDTFPSPPKNRTTRLSLSREVAPGGDPTAAETRYDNFRSMISPVRPEKPESWPAGASRSPPTPAPRTPQRSSPRNHGVRPSISPEAANNRRAQVIDASVRETFPRPPSGSKTLHERRRGVPLSHAGSKPFKTRTSGPTTPESATSSYFSDSSSPELEDASTAFFVTRRPVIVTSRPTSSIGTATPVSMTPVASLSRNPSVSTEPGNRRSVLEASPLAGRRRTQSFVSDQVQLELVDGPHFRQHLDGQTSTSSKRTSVASIASIELVQKGGVRSIDVRRRSGTLSSTKSATPPRRPESSYARTPTSSPWNERPSESPGASAPTSQPMQSTAGGSPGKTEQNDDFNSQGPPPIPKRSSRRASELSGRGSPLSPGEAQAVSSEDEVMPNGRLGVAPTSTPEAPRRVERASGEDQLEQQISSILTTIPAHIRLTSEEGEAKKRPSLPSYDTSPARRLPRASTPSFTLAPAPGRSPRPARHQGGNAEVRLFHLRRTAGNDAPIKLFVRQVGEHGERVMVRVGGGWADLGEYLREYASHHGQRSVSDGRVEIRDLPTPAGYGSGKSSVRNTPTASRPGSAQSSRPPGSTQSTRPGSGLAVRKTRAPSHSSSPVTPSMGRAGADTTPLSAASSGMRSSSRLSWTEEEGGHSVGLGGPKSRRTEPLSAEKQAWVEGLMGQVRGQREASEGARGEVEFGDLGRVGATKRVFRRGG
ncbi:MAG: hypothetical protein M1832_001608 [Thelocarpon impressellum]|nr:MAG: hypothetical protein M1832_001608 [Thelocarpon impressellum]